MSEETTTAALPPVGMIGETDHGAAASVLSQLVRESTVNREDMVRMADACVTIFHYGDSPAPSDDTLTLNKIQNAVINDTNIQVREPARATLRGVETGEKPDVYWVGPQMIGQLFGLLPQELGATFDAMGQQTPLQAIRPDVAEMLVTMMEHGQLVPNPLMPGAVMPFKEDWLAQVSDGTTAEVYQKIFDVLWARGNVDKWVKQNLLDTNTQGWSFGLYEFDDDAKKPRLRHLTIKQTYIDPICRDVGEAAYAGLDYVLDAAEAKRLYPALSEDIEKQAKTQQVERPENATDLGSIYESTTFERKIVTLRIFWLRNQPIPLTSEEAIGGALIQMRDVPDEVAIAAQQEAAQFAQFSEPLSTESPAIEQEQGSVDVDIEPEDGGAMPAEPQAMPIQPPPTPMRQAMFAGEQEVEEGGEGWPQRFGTRQVTILGNIVVDDRECEFWDIPLLHNVCIPLVGSRPYGIGEPWRLKNLQRAASRILHNGVEYTDALAHPGCAVPQSVVDATKAQFGDFHARPDEAMAVPDDLYIKFNGKLVDWYSPPTWPESNVKVLAELKANLTQDSGNQDVMQGSADSNMSGRAIAALQGAATSMIEFKSGRTADMVERIARLMLHSIVWRMDLDDLAAIVSKYPRSILEQIQQKGRALEWNVSVAVSSGTGAIKAQEKAEARENFKAQLIDRRTAQEALDVDWRLVDQRMEIERSKQMQMQPQVGPDGQPVQQAAPPNQAGQAGGMMN
jgi:hypothetical protein